MVKIKSKPFQVMYWLWILSMYCMCTVCVLIHLQDFRRQPFW
jgi:hypothetical protein